MEFHSYCLRMSRKPRRPTTWWVCSRGAIRHDPYELSPSHRQLLVGPLIPQFVAKNPQVRIAIEATIVGWTLRRISICVSGFARSERGFRLIMRSLGIIQQVLVASRGFLDRNGRPASPIDAARQATLSYGSVQGPHVWKLVDLDEKEVQVRHEPTLIADDMY